MPYERLYDRIGEGYPTTRRADPRIERRIHAALGDAETVLNVGAGAGAYEPADRRVTAVEPSPVMRAQRAPGAAPVVAASAERLPFPDGSFDAAMAVWTVHHWDDVDAGLGELGAHGGITTTGDSPRPSLSSVGTRGLSPNCSISSRVVTAGPTSSQDCADGFLGAFWARPEAYLDPAVRAGMSTLRAADATAVAAGLARLEDDLASGEWDARHGALREQAECDLGYRLVVATTG